MVWCVVVTLLQIYCWLLSVPLKKFRRPVSISWSYDRIWVAYFSGRSVCRNAQKRLSCSRRERSLHRSLRTVWSFSELAIYIPPSWSWLSGIRPQPSVKHFPAAFLGTTRYRELWSEWANDTAAARQSGISLQAMGWRQFSLSLSYVTPLTSCYAPKQSDRETGTGSRPLPERDLLREATRSRRRGGRLI